MKDLTAKEFLEILTEICDSREECDGCILCSNDSYVCLINDTDKHYKVIDIMNKYNRTWKSDLLEKYPNTPLNSKGNPVFCVLNIGKIGKCNRHKECTDCWNERMSENEKLL